MGYFDLINQPLNEFGEELTRLKTDIVTNLQPESRFNLLVGLSVANLAIGVAVKGIKSRPIQTGFISFFGFGLIIYPELYFGLIRQKKVQQQITHHFIKRD
ncbi:unnamed protein product [Paramecium octaurelia]|uniref:Uncharacterized protein n=1 Tax=Paramecium octaurelia TaxID=43137 RepID=A0A8S1TI23_PAROT|nr:unnamed protein product [Paramecium octaurelia]